MQDANTATATDLCSGFEMVTRLKSSRFRVQRSKFEVQSSRFKSSRGSQVLNALNLEP
jgi:hypothetical protein